MATEQQTPASEERVTPLMALMRACVDDAERTLFAQRAGTTVNYLYALAGCHRGQPRVGLAVAIEDASKWLKRRTRGRTPIVTVRQLALMCATSGLCEVAE